MSMSHEQANKPTTLQVRACTVLTNHTAIALPTVSVSAIVHAISVCGSMDPYLN